MKHIYTIPTHRVMSEENINDYFSEVNFANEKFKNDCVLIFFEDTEEYINYESIKKIGLRYPQTRCMYINRKDTIYIYNHIYDRLSLGAKRIFKKLYPNKNVNYGNVFNRIFLFGILLGAEYIYRRDSDVLIENANNKKIFPIEIEMKYLSTKDNDKIVYICGGGYKGKYDLDIESLIRDDGKDYSLVRKLFTCMSIPQEHHDDIINEEIINNNHKFIKDKVDFDSRAYPECGNVSMYKLHEYFPSSCQDFILGSDYYFIDVAVHSKLDVVYHNRAVIHRHTQDRKKEFNKVYNYWKGFLMLIDSQVFYRSFYERYLDKYNFNNYSNLDRVIDLITKDMQKEYQHFKKKAFAERKNKYMETLSVLSEADDSQIKQCAEILKNDINDIFNFTEVSIREHIRLIKHWNEIVSVTKKLSDMSEIKEFISKKVMENK